MDRGFFLTWQAVRRQLAAMPSELYLVRLIHHHSRAPFPAEPLWTGFQLCRAHAISFLRLRNREGFDIYIRPYAGNRNAGYILVDLDRAAPTVVHTLCANGHEPCVVLQTSPGHLQVWVHVSPNPIEAALASALGRHLAQTYGADWASTDWGHLGRLAGFTNRKPARRRPNGLAPWVRLLQAQPRLATQGPALLQAVQPGPSLPTSGAGDARALTPPSSPAISTAAATRVYARLLNRLRIPQRFPHPDWSIADLWIAKELLRGRIPAAQVQAILRLGSPGFPRRHSHPEAYLTRTLRRATLELESAPFSAPPGAPCVKTG